MTFQVIVQHDILQGNGAIPIDMRMPGGLGIDLQTGCPGPIADTAFDHFDRGGRKQALRFFQIRNQVPIGLEQMERQMIKSDGRKKTKRAQTKIGPTIKRNAAVRENGRGQLEKVRLKAPLQKSVPHLRIAQVDIGFGAVIELNPLIIATSERPLTNSRKKARNGVFAKGEKPEYLASRCVRECER
jgi:hypothetical protein